jgi:hypothetical protein
VNLRKDHSHEQSNFTVNFLCERLGGMPSAYAAVPMQNSRVAKQVWSHVFLLVPAAVCLYHNVCLSARSICIRCFVYLQLSATDVSAQATMKGAAKCDKHCELQNSVNQ